MYTHAKGQGFASERLYCFERVGVTVAANNHAANTMGCDSGQEFAKFIATDHFFVLEPVTQNRLSACFKGTQPGLVLGNFNLSGRTKAAVGINKVTNVMPNLKSGDSQGNFRQGPSQSPHPTRIGR